MMDTETTPNGQAPPDYLRAANNDYRAYLLRLWRSGPDGDWRGSLQSVQTGERHLFADMEALLAFLIEHVTATPKP